MWNLLSERLPTALQIQDFWHVSEHLHKLARELFGERSEKARERVRRVMHPGGTGILPMWA